MTPDKKKRTLRGILALLIAMCLIVLVFRLWPVLLLMILGLFGCALWALIHTYRQPDAPVSPPVDAPQTQPAPMSEQELLTIAFGLLQRRITEQVTAVHPHAKWVWAGPGARERFAAGGPITILLNDAGGYQRASVQVSGLQFYNLLYLPQNGVPVSARNLPNPQQENNQPPSVDYGLLAFEWVKANLQRLYAVNNDAASKGQTGFRILAEELPHGDSWPSICDELIRNGFVEAEPVADGIQVQIKSQGKENPSV